MAQLYGNAIIGQSGGPTAAINATLSGVIRGCLACNGIDKIYGAVNGIEGVLERRLLLLNGTLGSEEDFRLLENTPAAALGSCRKKLPPDTEGDNLMVYENLLDIFRDYNVRYFFYIGGNDSMDTVAKLSAFLQEVGYDMRVIGVPKTIDNDLVGTDHTPGFGSAAKYVATTMSEIMLDTAVYTVKAVTIVEIMGRGAGWLTAAAALPALSGEGAPDMVYLPESVFDYDDFFRDLDKAFEKHPNVVVAVSEGIRFKDGTYVGESGQSGATDAFGHKYLSGTAKVLENAVRERIGCKVRAVELNLPQRCAAHIASGTDIEESVRIGRAAVEYAAFGETGKMVVFVREPGDTYTIRIDCVDIGNVANAVRSVPGEFINENGNGVTEACLRYLQPLIVGETSPVYENGLPKHFRFEKKSGNQ